MESEFVWYKYPENKPPKNTMILKSWINNYDYVPSFELEYCINTINDLSGGNKVFAFAEIPDLGEELLSYRDELKKMSNQDYINFRNNNR